MPRRLWTTPLLGLLRSEDAVPVGRSFQSLTEYLRGHVGFWGIYTGTTTAGGQLTIPHNCGFTPRAAFAQALYDGSSPRNHYGPIHIESLDEDNLVLHILRANGTPDASSTRTLYYHILPVVSER
jgi:hypothetical protein